MTPWLSDPDLDVYVGDVRDVLPELPADSIDCIVTSPPYWNLRDYGTGDAQIGLEKVPDCLGWATGDPCGECFVCVLVAVFEDCRRVLAPHGTCWVNMGDSYAAKARGSDAGWDKSRLTNPGRVQKAQAAALRPAGERHRGKSIGLKSKDLIGTPWRLAFALQAAGWWLRADNIWFKRNAMPGPWKDRPTTSHEYVFQLAKRERYFFDMAAVREPYATGRGSGNLERKTSADVAGPETHDGNLGRSIPWQPASIEDPDLLQLDGFEPPAARGPDGRRVTHVEGGEGSLQPRSGERWPNEGRNLRTVWDIPTSPYDEAHFATFPVQLAHRCIAAGCPTRVCLECGKPSERIVDVDYENPGNRSSNGKRDGSGDFRDNGVRVMAGGVRLEKVTTTVGWTDCGHNAWRPGRVLDPFGGSGTTAAAARALGRHCTLVELSEDYARDFIAVRTQQLSLLADRV